ncbi:MAG: sugar phosphate isomerase/epimerase [Syntrophales bacterium]
MEQLALFPILKKVQVHIPFHFLCEQYLPRVLQYGMNPEISFNSATLDTYRETDYRRVADKLGDAGLRVTFHAPFMDLRPGAIDPRIRRVSEERIMQVLNLADYFRPVSIVCHPSFDDRYYVSSEDQWLENSLRTWGALLSRAGDIPVLLVLENVYEKGPRQLHRLLTSLSSPHCGFCFDTGHFNVFAREPLTAWIDTMAPFLRQVHIHDNHGQADEHLPVGAGSFPFGEFSLILREKGLCPIVTIEAHNENNLIKSLENMQHAALHGEEFPC